MTLPPAPRALVVINGDDVYEDLFSAGLKLVVHASNVFPGSAAGPDPAYRVAHALIGSRFLSHGPPPHESRFQVETEQRRPVTQSMAHGEGTP
jgi:hypothetical protein